MKLAIMQPYFFPYVGYWQLIKEVDTFVIFDDVNFIKRGYINRNNILINGESGLITLELVGASQNKLINEIEVGNNRNKLVKTIEMAYSKAPFFKNTFSLISDLILHDETSLAKYLGRIISEMSNRLELNTKFIFSSEINNKKELKAQDKIIDICSIMGATSYFNLPGGKELYKEDEFNKKNIDLKFIDVRVDKYKQYNNEFVSHLSIIDYLMFNGIEGF